MAKGLKVIDPHQAVIEMGRDYSEMVEEVARLHHELDHYRKALQQIMFMPLEAIAADPNKPRLVATIAISQGTVTEVPEPPPQKIIL